MKFKNLFFISVFFLFYTTVIHAQSQQDSTKEEHIKKGFSFGILPALSYDSDLGFLYGVIANVYHFGDGSNYPNYNHSLYLEWSRTTKGSGKNIMIYESKTLIKNVRTIFETSYLTEKAIGFFGFNGAESMFIKDYEDDTSPYYKSRLYYRHDRKYFIGRAEFQGNIIQNKLRWMAGYAYINNKIASIDVDNLNKGKDPEDTLPHVNTLYDDYVEWGVIKEDEKNGGHENQIKFGIVYDTRDNDANPMKGLWEELLFLTVPSFLGNDYSYVKLILTHHQYFTIIKKKMNFAYRISYQPKIYGDIPFYSLPFLQSSYRIRDGLGGAKSLRGIYRNRIVGDDYLFGNFEIRWKFYNTVVFNQNFYIAFFPYVDAGMVTKDYKIDISNVPDYRKDEFLIGQEKMHLSYGAGLAFALNDNFIVNATYGLSNSSCDGRNSLYIGLNFLF